MLKEKSKCQIKFGLSICELGVIFCESPHLIKDFVDFRYVYKLILRCYVIDLEL